MLSKMQFPILFFALLAIGQPMTEAASAPLDRTTVSATETDLVYDPTLASPAALVPSDATIIEPSLAEVDLPRASPYAGSAIPPRPDRPVDATPPAPTGADVACSTIQVEVRWSFLEEPPYTSFRYLRDATVRIWDEEYGSDYLLTVATLDSYGYHKTGPIPNDDGWGQGTLDIYAEVYSWTDPGVAVKTRMSFNGYSAYTSTQQNVDPSGSNCVVQLGHYYPANDQDSWRHYAWGLDSWRHASSFDRGNMPLVKIYFPDNGAGGGPHYEKETRVISMWTGSDYLHPDVTYHEHGHAINHWAYSWENFPAPYAFHSRCDDNQGWNLAFGEGWADFWAMYVKARTRGTFVDWNGWSIESSVCANPPTGGQPDNEWIVAKSFWDLYDSPADGYDASGMGSGTLNPSTNSIWKVLWSQADPQSYQEFKVKWESMGYSANTFLQTARQNTITNW